LIVKGLKNGLWHRGMETDLQRLNCIIKTGLTPFKIPDDQFAPLNGTHPGEERG